MIVLKVFITVFPVLLYLLGTPAIGQNINNTFSSTSSFQSKASILDNMPSRNITVGDISIAYKQIGKADAKPIILITGGGATMDMWNPLLLEKLASANYKVIIFENRGVGESTAGKKYSQSVSSQMTHRVCSTL